MHNVPHQVQAFIDCLGSVDYLFLVFAGAGEAGRGMGKAARRLQRRAARRTAVFNLAMPSNYTPFGAPDPEKTAALLAAAEGRMDRIAETVQRRAAHRDGPGVSAMAAFLFPGALFHLAFRFVPGMDRRFVAQDHCTRCGLCGQVCPVGNISFHEGRPTWNRHCEQCFACLHWCPVQAIQYGTATVGRERYHHPEVTAADIMSGAGYPGK
jgi:ferredoxin